MFASDTVTSRDAPSVVIGPLALALILTLSACSGPEGDTGGPDPARLVSIRLEPVNPVLMAENGAPVTQAFAVIAMVEGGSEYDVTDEAALTLEMSWLGSLDGARFQSNADVAGRSALTASYRDQTATGEVTVVSTSVVIAPGAPANAPELFDSAPTGGEAPTLVYPASNTIVPPNLNSMEFHFRPGGQNDLFLLDVVGGLVQLRIYIPCAPLGGGCMYAPDEDTWALLASAGRGEAPMFYTISGLNRSSGAAQGISQSRSIQFSFHDIEGGLYYWDAGAGAVKRYDFGLRGQSAEHFLGILETGATQCVGCHTLSRDGSTIAVGLDVPGPAAVEAYTVGERERLWGAGGMFSGGANFFTFSPDNAQIIMSNGVSMSLHDAATGAELAPIISNGTMPDWSPDGSQVVYARASAPAPCPIPELCAATGIAGGNIEVVDAGNWGATGTIAPAGGGNNYYPSFSPDGEWIIYNRTNLGDSYDAADARVWAVHRTGGELVALANASPAPGGDSWPKWAPFVDEFRSGSLMWLTFSSRRDYGLRNTGGNNPAQLWMVGFDPARAAQGQDPSFSSFWLPFQDPASGNHIAQWVERIDRQTCENDGDCPGNEFCEGGYCLPRIE